MGNLYKEKQIQNNWYKVWGEILLRELYFKVVSLENK